MRSKTWIYLAGAIIALILLVGTFSTGMFLGGVLAADDSPELIGDLPLSLPSFTPGSTEPSNEAAPPQDRDELFAPFWQSWDLVHEQFVDQPVDDEALMRGAISGMLEALGDQHTSYMDPDQYKQANIPLEGEYEGIGAWVDPNAEYLTIVSPMPDSPAEAAGLKPGDEIIGIDGEDMTGIDGNLVIRKVMGPAGTEVTLTIRREDLEEPFDVNLQRAHIVVPSVESEMLEGDIAYVQLFNFGDKTTDELRDGLRELMAEDPVGLVLDLRNNGGGALRTAIEVASEFISDGVIMYEEYGDGTRDTYEATRGGLATEIPVVVLINEGTASASEIVAGAIQDHGRGQLVGVTSFGKGSVQIWTPLDKEQGAVRVTIARWLTPDGRTINETGLEPDIVVELTEEDITAERDPQLDKAVELLTQ
jgi:carboxyl-terminal processing protease